MGSQLNGKQHSNDVPSPKDRATDALNQLLTHVSIVIKMSVTSVDYLLVSVGVPSTKWVSITSPSVTDTGRRKLKDNTEELTWDK